MHLASQIWFDNPISNFLYVNEWDYFFAIFSEPTCWIYGRKRCEDRVRVC